MNNSTGLQMGPSPVRLTPQSISAPRARILEVLQAAQFNETAATIAERTGLHHNTVREHLDALVDLGLVDKVKSSPRGRGRPSWQFKASDVLTEHDPRVREFAGLASALSAYISKTSDNPREEAIEAGRLWGQELVARRGISPKGEPRKKVVEILDNLGFAPKADSNCESVALTRCPLLDVAKQYPEVVCAAHLGLVTGALESFGSPQVDVELAAFSEPGACRLSM